MAYLSNLKSLGVSLVLLGLVATSAAAQSSPGDKVTPDQIASTLNNMGYSPRVNQGTVSFNADSLVINAQCSNDGSIVYLSAYYGITPQQAPKAPALKLLNYNDTHRTYAFVDLDSNNVPTDVGVYLQIMAPAFSPQAMRQAIDNITGDMNANQAVLSPNNW